MNFNSIKVNLQYFLPKHLLTRGVGLLAGAKLKKVTTAAIRLFIRAYDVDTSEIEGNIEDFETFNDFFARALKHGSRPIDKNKDSLVFPADGRISQFGSLEGNFQLQAKNHYFTTAALLGNNDDASLFTDGKFMTIYLSPQDYHRVHIPAAGKLLKMTHIPGELFSVNPLYVSEIPELFSRNERVVCLFETAFGKMAVVMVGAAIVRSISTDWAGVVAPAKSNEVSTFSYDKQNISFAKGDEIGKFMMGSTVICLFENKKIKFEKELTDQQKTRMGQKMATLGAAADKKDVIEQKAATKRKNTRKTS